MNHHPADLLANNRAWAARIEADQPGFFARLAHQQTPRYLWIGCADSRVPANEIIGLAPGEVFVHRNIANVVVHSDLNALSVIQYAVDRLHVQHIMVVGHYGCGGVLAALEGVRVGLADNWLRHVHDVKLRHAARLEQMDLAAQRDRLCELNVIEQVANVAQTNVLQDAWARGQRVAVHGWCYGLADGLLHDLAVTLHSAAQVAPVLAQALARYPSPAGLVQGHKQFLQIRLYRSPSLRKQLLKR